MNLFSTIRPAFLQDSPSASVRDLVAPLDQKAAKSKRLFSIPIGWSERKRGIREIPRYLFMGPTGGSENVRIGLFAGIHGDEPAGSFALVKLLDELERNPHLAHGYELFVYPVCNPTGFEAGSRFSAGGVDLNREFWTNSKQPEVRALEAEISALRFDGILSFHSDDTSDGLYGFVAGPTLTRELLSPALREASRYCAINQQSIIDSFSASGGIIESGYKGVLSAPPAQKPKPFEIVFETPHSAPLGHQVDAMLTATLSILDSFRRLRAFANHI